MKTKSRLKFLLLVILASGSGWLFEAITHGQQNANPARLDFNRDIRPLLSDKCWACHGPDAPNKKITLRLDSEAGMRAALSGGKHAVVTNHPEQSEMIARITAQDKDERMPPTYSGKSLTPREIELLTEWIKQGAVWQSHWSFNKPVRPEIPTVKNQAWIKNPIDSFILAKLEREGLEPAPEADRAPLLRRVSFDLTGLPPTLTELDNFINDKSPQAYEKVVDRLLASPRYGERMAFKWLDAARYADTNGYQIDGDRNAWRWRDWVIEAFNANMPFDQFTIEQLAGDLLPNPTLEQKIATAFNRNHRINAEGGVVPEEYRVEYVVDRVDTTATVFMGLTLGCARCHNHKFDPFTQKEYYQLNAYFNNIPEDGHAFDYGNSPPWIVAPTRAQQQQLQLLNQQIVQAEKQYKSWEEKSLNQQHDWEKLQLNQPANRHWFPTEKLLAQFSLDENSAPVFNQSDRAYYEEYGKKKEDPETKFETGFKDGNPRFVAAPTGPGVAFDGKLFFDAGLHADFRYKSTSKDYKERFTIAAWVYPENEQSGSIVTKVSDNPAEIENGIPRAEGYGLYFLNGKIHFNMVFRWGEDTLRVETENTLPLKQWQQVTVVFDGLKQRDERLHIYVDGHEQKLNFNQRSFYLLMGGTKNTLKIGAGGGPQFRFKGALDEVRIYSRALAEDEINVLACADSLEKILTIAEANRTPAQAQKLQLAFVAQAAPDELKQAYNQIIELNQQKQKFTDDLPTLMVMEEMPAPRPTFLLKRGAYDAPGERVERGVPATLPPLQYPDKHLAPGSNRLDFAKWLVSPEHPLTARVQVNRFWQSLFGIGLVKTVEDFGSQGELPSHPELLDWLAVGFRDGATGRQGDGANHPTTDHRPPTTWNIKALLKLMVMSATYRQASSLHPLSFSPHPSERDPDNRWLARGARFRLSAEMIRDQALFAAGLLVEKLGGPSVKPYQPDGLYKDMAFGGLTGYSQEKGDGLWRRSLYTFWKRTILAPNMQVFDATAREACTVREVRTNTPLQALNMMNDVTYIEAARMLAERIIKEGGKTSEVRLSWAFRLVTSRWPAQREKEIMLNNLQAQLKYFQANPKEVTKLLAVGERRNDAQLNVTEIAAYTTIASLLLNLDEVITKQ